MPRLSWSVVLACTWLAACDGARAADEIRLEGARAHDEMARRAEQVRGRR